MDGVGPAVTRRGTPRRTTLGLLIAAVVVGLGTGLLVHSGDLGGAVTFPPLWIAVGCAVAGTVALRAGRRGRDR